MPRAGAWKVSRRLRAVTELWLAAAEQKLVNHAGADEQAWLANLIWSAKEAAAKARGEGLRLDVRHAKVSFGGPPRSSCQWCRLRVDWEGDSGAADRDDGWFRRELGWVMTVVGGDAGAAPVQIS